MRSSIIFSFLLSTTVAQDNLLEILQVPISDAMCVAKCSEVPTHTSKAQCYQVCKFRQTHPKTDLCRVPDLCVDFGCQVGCQDHDGAEQAVFDGFSRNKCQLSWSLSETESRVVFVLAGQDHEERWSLLSGHKVDVGNTVAGHQVNTGSSATGNMTGTSFYMSSAFGLKHHTIAVIAVSSAQVLDVLLVKIPLYQECPEEKTDDIITKTIVNGIEDSEFITVICLSLLVLCLFLVLVCVLSCHKKKRPASDSLSHLTSKHRQTVMRSKIDGKTKIYQDVLRSPSSTLTENTYIAFPSVSTSFENIYVA